MRNVSELLGETITKIRNENDELTFHCESGKNYKLYHSQDCCETVYIDDICGDLEDLIGSPIVVAAEVSNDDFEEENEKEYSESYTWTFYKFATKKGFVDIRWYGSSNGYYSEAVDFILLGVDRERY